MVQMHLYKSIYSYLTCRMTPLVWSSWSAFLASEPRTFIRSDTIEGVISLYVGT